MEIRNRGSAFPRLPIPPSYPGRPSETPFKATPGCESVVVVKILEEFPREIRVLHRMLSCVLSRLETSPFRSSFRLAPSPSNRELRNVPFAIRRHVVHFNIDRLARLICRGLSKSWCISATTVYSNFP